MKLYGGYDVEVPDDAVVIGGIYFHGKLERACGYDLFYAEENLPDGITHHQAVLPDGTIVPCTAYVWTHVHKFHHSTNRYGRYDAWDEVHKMRRGLVITDDEDPDVVKDVIETYEERPEDI